MASLRKNAYQKVFPKNAFSALNIQVFSANNHKLFKVGKIRNYDEKTLEMISRKNIPIFLKAFFTKSAQKMLVVASGFVKITTALTVKPSGPGQKFETLSCQGK